MVAAVQGAKEVELASYMFDDAKLVDALSDRLSDGSRFPFNVHLDRQAFAGTQPRQQSSRVQKLHAKGAKVYLCKGFGRLGSYHAKEVVVDRRVLYTGSANLTTNSRS